MTAQTTEQKNKVAQNSTQNKEQNLAESAAQKTTQNSTQSNSDKKHTNAPVSNKDLHQISRDAAIREFMSAIQKLNDPDFGDFKRKAGLYLQRLMEALKNSDAPTRAQLTEMKYKLSYENSTLEIHETRRELIEQALRLS